MKVNASMLNINSRLWMRLASKGRLERRIFCFPYAGGGPASFMKFESYLDAGTELVSLQLPGRGDRLDEPPALDIMQLLIEIAQDTHHFDDVPAIFFGHSLGAILAFETARRCRDTWLKGIIVSGCIAPSFWPTTRGRQLSTLNDDDLVNALRNYQGMPAELLDDIELLHFFLPVLRADFSLVASYRYQPDASLTIPVTVLAGDHDPHVDLQRLPEWQQQTAIPITTDIMSGNHFFFERHIDRIMDHAHSLAHCSKNSIQAQPCIDSMFEI